MKKNERLLDLLKDIYEYKKLHLIAGALTIVGILGSLIMPTLIKNIIDFGIIQKNIDLIKKYIFISLVVYIIQSVVNYYSKYIYAIIRKKFIVKFRRKILKKSSILSGKVLSQIKIGKLLNIIDNDVVEVADFTTNIVFEVIKDFVMAVGVFVLLVKLDYELLICMIITQIVLFIVNKKLNDKLAKYSKMRADNNDIRRSILQEYVSNIIYIVSSNIQKYSFDKYNKYELLSQENRIKIIKNLGTNSSVSGFLHTLSILLIWGYGGYKVIHGSLTLGDLYAFNMYSGKFFAPILRLVEKSGNYRTALVSIDRIYNLLEEPVQKSKEELYMRSEFEKNITFKNVYFKYDNNEEMVLNNINLSIDKGQKVAFVGHSGSGKTTIINLMLRLWEVNKGRILIDGVDIKKYRVKDVRSIVSIVSQDIVIFDDSILMNITLGKKVEYKKVIEISKRVGIYEYINSLPEQFNTRAGENGVRLSGGQKQRLSIARALIKDASILIFDEATAHLDNISEKIVKELLIKQYNDKTIIIITHRLNTIDNVDIIYVLKDGRIVEKGSQKELLSNSNEYYDLYSAN